jgi:hypothetical protein
MSYLNALIFNVISRGKENINACLRPDKSGQAGRDTEYTKDAPECSATGQAENYKDFFT